MEYKFNIKFSIIIPTYNRANMIGKAIDSILAQTYTNWELIIVDDGSTDNTKDVVQAYNDNRINYFYQENKGRSAARNYGIDMSEGDYISFLDDDDCYLPDFLIEFNRFIHVNDIKKGLIVGNAIENINGNLTKVPERIKGNNFVKNYWKYNDISINSFVISSDVVKKYKFPEKFYMWEDKYFILVIMLNYKCYYLNKYLSVYRDHENRSVNVSYGIEYKNNAINRYAALRDFDNKYKDQMLMYLKPNEYYYGIMKYFYWLSCISMKNYDFNFSLFWLIKIYRFKFNYFTIYSILSVLSRIPFYWLKRKK